MLCTKKYVQRDTLTSANHFSVAEKINIFQRIDHFTPTFSARSRVGGRRFAAGQFAQVPGGHVRDVDGRPERPVRGPQPALPAGLRDVLRRAAAAAATEPAPPPAPAPLQADRKW